MNAAASPTITVALLDPSGGQQSASVIASDRSLKLIGIASDPTALVDEVAKEPPSVVLVDTRALPADALLDLTARLRDSTAIIVAGDAADGALLSHAIRAGARSLLVRPYEPDDLLSVIHEVAGHATARAQRRMGSGAVVITVYSPKGGAGATTVATTLAVALAQAHAGRVGIIDLDLRFGGVGIALDLRGQNTITDLLARSGPLDPGLIDDTFVAHQSGVKVLLSPETPALADSVSPEALAPLIAALRSHFEYLVIDLPTSFDDLTAAALRVADRVLLVATPELPALRDVQRIMSIAPELRNGRSQVVLNRWPSRSGVPLADVERALGRKVALAIPSEGVAVTRALNTGISLLDRRAGLKNAGRFRDLVRLVTANGG